MNNLSIGIRAAVMASAIASTLAGARADVGVIVYQSKGTDTRQTSSGHLALISTTLCAAGVDHLRQCAAGEEPGAIVTYYSNVASNYGKTIFVAPLRGHLTANLAGPPTPGVSGEDEIPVLSNGLSLEAMQIEYWRKYLRPYLPPLSQEQYEAIRRKQKEFDAGRIFRRTITLQYLAMLLGPHKKKAASEPIAMTDPANGELIPDGRWREAIGEQYLRRAIIITTPTSPQQDERLLRYIAETHATSYNALNENCSDFVSRGLRAVFGDAGFKTRPRIRHVADAWITSPIAVTSDFVAFAKHRQLPLDVTLVPMIAGTRRPTAMITSISRGALIPDSDQGKLAFVLKAYFNKMNPLLGYVSFSVDKASNFSDLQDLVHQRGNADLSYLNNAVRFQREPSRDDKHALQREQMETFGTASCWQAKRADFARIETSATREQVLSAAEHSLLLKNGQPYLLPRLYERIAGGKLNAGVQQCVRGGCGGNLVSSFLPAADAGPVRELPDAIPNRAQIKTMAGSDERADLRTGFRLMTAVINYDLSSDPVARRTTGEFDRDWQLYLRVAQGNELEIPQTKSARESVAACSVGEFDSGTVRVDAYQRDRALHRKLWRQLRGLLYGANR